MRLFHPVKDTAVTRYPIQWDIVATWVGVGLFSACAWVGIVLLIKSIGIGTFAAALCAAIATVMLLPAVFPRRFSW